MTKTPKHKAGRWIRHLTAMGGSALIAASLSTAAMADPVHSGAGFAVKAGAHGVVRADGHAPIGVMGDHMHKEGEIMFSYRFMHMDMKGNRIGTDSVSPETIVTTVPNRFFGMPGQPPTLRIVPTQMDMDMHMFGAMFAPTDWMTLMVMFNYVSKSMDHITFAGPRGTRRLGVFTTETEGLADTPVTALIRLLDQGGHHLHLNLGIRLPSGNNTETDQILAPTGARPTVRLPYPMQLSSGTFDGLIGVTYTGRNGDVSWGAQYSGIVPLENRNEEGYRLGDLHQLTGWIAYQWAPWISTSFRALGQTQDDIAGIDPMIVGPVQTANPLFHGGDRIDLLLGVNLVGQEGIIHGHRLAVEVGFPVYQDLNGPQMETDLTVTVGWQKTIN